MDKVNDERIDHSLMGLCHALSLACKNRGITSEFTITVKFPETERGVTLTFTNGETQGATSARGLKEAA